MVCGSVKCFLLAAKGRDANDSSVECLFVKMEGRKRARLNMATLPVTHCGLGTTFN